MKTNRLALVQLFQQNIRYVVPVFQRHYVWDEKDQWTPLWEDIVGRFQRFKGAPPTSSHFLGAIILDAKKTDSVMDVPSYVVIDGQQRLTTLQIILVALRDISISIGKTDITRSVERLILNPDPTLMQDPSSEIYKLWPTEFNRDTFLKLINAKSKEAAEVAFPLVRGKYKRKPERRDRLVEAYLFFYNRFESLLKDKNTGLIDEEALFSIFTTIKSNLTIVEIVLEESDNAEDIFNSLNSRGKPLSQSDLLRSFIFMRAEKSSVNRDLLFNKYWKSFEIKFWDEERRRGNLTISNLDFLTRVFLAAQTGKFIDAKRVHLEYKEWIKLSSPFENLESELSLFKRYGDKFISLESDQVQVSSDRIANRFKKWGVSTIYPLLLFLIVESNLSDEELSKCLRMLESFVVRRAVCGRDEKDYNKYFVELVSKLRTSQVTVRGLWNLLNTPTGSTRDWPSDIEFEEKWTTCSFYGDQAVLKSDQLVSLLTIIENSLSSNKSEVVAHQGLSIEHVMPQTWTENYFLNGVKIPREMEGYYYAAPDDEKKQFYDQYKQAIFNRKKLIHTIGNLTLVTSPLNSSMRNSAWEKKKTELKNSRLILNSRLTANSDWDDEVIMKRSKELFASAIKIWPKDAPV